MDALNKQGFLQWLEHQFLELEDPQQNKYCLWTCPECERVLISGGKYGNSFKMENDLAICIGSYAYHRPKNWFRNPAEKYDLSFFQQYYLTDEDFHMPKDMGVNKIYLTREQYINTFEDD